MSSVGLDVHIAKLSDRLIVFDHSRTYIGNNTRYLSFVFELSFVHKFLDKFKLNFFLNKNIGELFILHVYNEKCL